jgi:hypothetical protein
MSSWALRSTQNPVRGTERSFTIGKAVAANVWSYNSTIPYTSMKREETALLLL